MTAVKTIGILGAGQLGRMTAVAAAQREALVARLDLNLGHFVVE